LIDKEDLIIPVAENHFENFIKHNLRKGGV